MADALETIGSHLSDATRGHGSAVHRARVASRRLREALALAAAVAADGEAARTRREVRRLTRALGPVREADVTLETLSASAARHGWRRTGAAAVRRRVDADRTRRRRRLGTRIEAFDFDALRVRVDQVISTLERGPAQGEWARALGARLQRRADALIAAVKRCGTIYAPERLHAVRIAVKKLRYALEIAGDAHVVDAETDLAALQHAQQSFGELHDLQVLLADVRAAAASVRRTAMGEILESMVATIERDCRERHAEALVLLPQLADRAAGVRRSAAMLRGRRKMIKLQTAHAARTGAMRRDRRGAGARQRSVS